MCLDGASRAGVELLSSVSHSDLRVYFAWTPMLPADGEAAAGMAAGPILDVRAAHYWDGERHLASLMGAALGIRESESIPLGHGVGAAWDVYLAYGRGGADIGKPAFWMHQLGVVHAPRLDVEDWRRRVEGLLDSGAL